MASVLGVVSTSGNKQFSYLEQRAAEACAPSVIRRTRAALAFFEESEQMRSKRLSQERKRTSVANALNLPGGRGAPGHEPRTTTCIALLRVLAMLGCVDSIAVLRSSRAFASKLQHQ